jgi:hypothetical protein
MKHIPEYTLQTVVSRLHAMGQYLFAALVAGAILCTAQPTVALEVDPAIGQAVFATPEDATNSFIQAIRNHDVDLMGKLLGSDYREVLPLEEVDRQDVDNFLVAWEKQNTLLEEGEQKVLIAVGEEKWTLPIPIVAGTSGWYFDIDEGLDRMRIRRIGRNELATMQAVLAYYDAQKEYAEQDRNDDGLLEYARQFISTPGARDGLYWEVEPGETPSPLGPLVADHAPGGGYHGYLYRILEAQGEHARGGAYSYMINGRMRAGFAVIAWPADYGESGVMSFMVSHSGIVYEQDLGPDGAGIAEEMQAYNPAPDWTLVSEVNDTRASSSQ